MTRPTTYFLRMLLFLAVVAAVVVVLFPTLLAAFQANPVLDGLILAVLLLGIVWNLVMVLRLSPEVRWIETLRQPRAGLAPPSPPRLLTGWCCPRPPPARCSTACRRGWTRAASCRAT